jgi:hypothetical protein
VIVHKYSCLIRRLSVALTLMGNTEIRDLVRDAKLGLRPGEICWIHVPEQNANFDTILKAHVTFHLSDCSLSIYQRGISTYYGGDE